MSEEEEYLSVAEAAAYVGVSAQTLRRWDRDGRLPAIRRPGSTYRNYRRADLEPFRLEYRRAAEAATTGGEVFATANANIEAISSRLRSTLPVSAVRTGELSA